MNPQPYSNTTTTKGRAESPPFAREVYRAEVVRDEREDLLGELAALRAEVRTEVRSLRGAMNRPKANLELTAELAALRAAVDELLATPKRTDALASIFRTRGIEGGAAAALAKLANARSRAKNKGRASNKNAGVADAFAAAVASFVAVAPWPIAHAGPSLIALVGPAGVGKTTTAAKLGARAIRANKTVAFISCDGYRVGAMDQLRRYAEIMEASFHAVNHPDELIDVVRGITADVIIVDTSGRAVEPSSVEAMLGDARLRSDPSLGRRIEVLLLAPAALRASDASRIARDFATTEPTSLCVTKLDETDAPSALVHAPFATRLPISTVCFGQRVPEDIGTASLDDVVERLAPLGSSHDANDSEMREASRPTGYADVTDVIDVTGDEEPAQDEAQDKAQSAAESAGR